MAGRGAGGTGGRPGRPARPSASARRSPQKSGTKKGAASTGGAPKGASPKPATSTAPQPARGRFRLGAIEGATPGKWIGTWRERMPHVALELAPLSIADQRQALTTATVDAALVRLPIDRTDLHVIRLYDEVPVVVCAADSHLTAVDELTLADLSGEVIIVPQHPPLELEVPGGETPRFAAPDTVADAIAIAASGAGIVIVPMSLARLHHRKDAAHRPLTDGPTSSIALAWPAASATGPDATAAAFVETFIGIVRGRTANSSR
ncbi:LysR substrate-binding domain-containing protein [uncultured Microbacterium sp.]|uniref:LysR substrate-binding domain-containing protein n=1 Tax=uncultured Microbacterium sp. TaxID=191216 RepID=UPI00260094C8|nr:LysR substrate-binding domain-containing protein [uncultured Microbacterium sp.]